MRSQMNPLQRTPLALIQFFTSNMSNLCTSTMEERGLEGPVPGPAVSIDGEVGISGLGRRQVALYRVPIGCGMHPVLLAPSLLSADSG